MTSIAKPMEDKVCLITGATSGIGRVAALELARQGACVVIVGRDQARCEAVVREITAQTGNERVEALLADLSSQQQIRGLADQFRGRYDRLDVLVNNAGAIWLQRLLTVDGLEMTFAVNHLAYFLLTMLLLDALKKGTAARIVNVASEAHRRGSIEFDDPMLEHGYGGWRAYCQSKLANLLFTYELDRRLEGKGITVNALHPGWVATGFASRNGWRGWVMQQAARFFALSPARGAQTINYLATSPDVSGTGGRYFIRCKAVPSSPASNDPAAARRLWQLSQQLTGAPASS
jgi:NAD(P)-dependent dehydrogenase (short-subunit alcohol dehydrogenase family)